MCENQIYYVPKITQKLSVKNVVEILIVSGDIAGHAVIFVNYNRKGMATRSHF